MANSTTVTADGVQTDFSVPFPFLDRAHVKVRLSGVLQSPPAYSWTTASTLRFTAPPPYGAVVYISRETPLTPVSDFSEGATLDANSLDRALRQPLYLVEDLETGDTSVEAAAILADAAAYTNTREAAIRADFPAVGGGAPVGASYITLNNEGGLSNERKLVAGANVTLTESGATLVIAASGGGGGGSSSPYFNPKTYGAFGDGETHPLSATYATLAEAQAVFPHAVALTDQFDWCAIQAAINAAQAVSTGNTYAQGATVFIPKGSYRLNRTLTVTKPIAIIGEGYGDLTTNPDGSGRGGTQLYAITEMADTPIIRVNPTVGQYCIGGRIEGLQLHGFGLPSYCLHVSCVSRWNFDVATLGARLAGVRCDDNSSAVYSFANEWRVHYSYSDYVSCYGSHGLYFIGGAAGNPQQIVHRATGIIYNGDGLRLEDEVDNLVCYHSAFSRAPDGTGRNVAFINGPGPSVPRVCYLHYVAGGIIHADAGVFGVRVGTSSETTTISGNGSGQIHYEVIDYSTGGMWRTRNYWMSDTLELGTHDFHETGAAVGATLSQLGAQIACWKLAPSADQGVSAAVPVPRTWGPGFIKSVTIKYSTDVAITGTGVTFRVGIKASSPNVDVSATSVTNSHTATYTQFSSTQRRHHQGVAVLTTPEPVKYGDMLLVDVRRLGTDVNDGVDQDVYILGVTLNYEATGPASPGSGTFYIPRMGD